MTKNLASCACGQLTLSCEGSPVRISMCHCLECQKRTGSVFGVQARFSKDHVLIAGNSHNFKRKGDSGGEITFHFCPTCGSTVYWQVHAIQDFLSVAVGAFTNPQFPSPMFSVYESRRHPWTHMPHLNVEKLG